MARRITKEELRQQAGNSAPVVEPAYRGEPVYPLQVYLDNAKAMLGVERYTIVGAVSDRDNPSGEYTKSEIQALVIRFLNTPLS